MILASDTMQSPATDNTADVAEAVRNLLPGLRKQSLNSVVLIAASLAVGGVLTALIFSSRMEGVDKMKLTVIVLGVAIALSFYAHRWMRRTQEAMVMPVLAQAVGLTYSKNARPFADHLPKRLLPKGIRTAEDHVHGKLGAHAIQMAEVNVETGGKNSRTLFKGIVAQFSNRVLMPAFFIAPADKTRPGIFFGGDLSTEGLHHLQDVQRGTTGPVYGVWISRPDLEVHPALHAVLDILTLIESHVGPGAELYAATSNGEEMHIALTHKRNLFRVGGLFPNEAAIFQDVQAAMQDLSVPLTLAKALIEAEEKAGQNVKGA
jgi:hypothetical protein